MKLVPDKISAVLAGAFNPAILTPQWVAIHGLGYPEEQQFVVDMHVGAGVPTRFAFDGISFTPTYGNLAFHLDPTNEADCQKAIEATARILEKLPHTPISGLGLNFAFMEDELSESLLSLLKASPDLTLSFGEESQVVSRSWSNTVSWGDATVRVVCRLEGDIVLIDQNFHYAVNSAAEAAVVLHRVDAFQNHYRAAITAATALTKTQLDA